MTFSEVKSLLFIVAMVSLFVFVKTDIVPDTVLVFIAAIIGLYFSIKYGYTKYTTSLEREIFNNQKKECIELKKLNTRYKNQIEEMKLLGVTYKKSRKKKIGRKLEL